VIARLVASPAVVERRLRGREAGGQLAEHLAESASFAAEAEDASIGEAIATDDLDASAVARTVLRLAGWS
jgi:ribose 1,5-bisphosphokinase PhnN